jgi:hypothetical protein
MEEAEEEVKEVAVLISAVVAISSPRKKRVT